MPKTSCLKWPGGKSYLAKWIVSLMPTHLTYCEPYFGGGSVLFERDPADQRLWLPPHRGVSEVINDINLDLTNFWKVLQGGDSFKAFHRLCQMTPFSGIEFSDAKREFIDWPKIVEESRDVITRAWKFFIVVRQSLAGRMQGFTGITKTRLRSGMNNEVSAWLSAVEGLPAVHERLKRVLILPSMPAIDVIKKFDMPDTLVYADPPYLHSTRVTKEEYGKYEMSEADHIELLEVFTKCKAKVMISGYASELYDSELKGWRREIKLIPNQASGAKNKEIKEEVLWLNF